MSRFPGMLAFAYSLLSVATISASEIRAGVARIDLTPPAEIEATLGGYGERMSRPAEGVHDRVFAKAIVFAGQNRRFVLVTADVLGFPPPVKRAVVDRLKKDGWTSAQVMLLPSHSHTSIEMMQINPKNDLKIPQLGLFSQQVYEWTVSRLVEVIQAASEHLEAVSIGTTRIELRGWNSNRRHRGGTVDPDLTVTRIDKHSGKPLVVLVNWTAHPTFMSGEDMMFSGGWPGHMQRTLEALIGGGITAMYYNGAEGDQRPLARPDSGNSHWERAERYGRELALVVAKAYRGIQTDADVKFDYRLQPITLPKRVAHPQFRKTGGAEYGLNDQRMERLLSVLVPSKTASGVLRLGDLLVVGIPGELAAELGLEIKHAAAEITDARFVTIGGLANEWVSYMLPRREYEKGGYESSVSFYGASLGETIVEQAIAGVRKLSAQSPASR